MKEQFALWRIKDKYDFVVHKGICKFPPEFDLDSLPGGWCGDRDINDISIWKNLMVISWIHPTDKKKR